MVLTVSLRYRQVVATILLMVYTFIAAPVQLWHHHSVSNGKRHAVVSKNVSLSQGTNNASEADCPICNHVYSAYNGEIFICCLVPAGEFSFEFGYYIPSFHTLSSFSLPGRGPPSLG